VGTASDTKHNNIYTGSSPENAKEPKARDEIEYTEYNPPQEILIPVYSTCKLFVCQKRQKS
jgi:hypothetical protein